MIEDIAAGVVTGMATHKAIKTSEDISPLTPPDPQLETLKHVERTMAAIYTYLHKVAPPELADIYKVVTLYKLGYGPSWVPSTEERQYVRILNTVPIALNINSILGPPFVLTIPIPGVPYLWTSLDFPDQTSYILDSTASASQLNIYVRFTNEKP